MQASFAQIEPDASTVAATFYRRLFELNPNLAPLFTNDIERQGIKFMEKLAVAVMGLEDLDSIGSLVQALGRRHVGYGVRPADYETARDALLWTLAEHFGPAYKPDLHSAWSAAFDMLCMEMIRATESGDVAS